jgi:hypothetical protein
VAEVEIRLFCTFLLLLSLFGCGSSIIVSPLGCKTSARFIDGSKIPDFKVERSFWAPFGLFETTVVKIKDLLKQEGISCKDVGTLTVTTTHSVEDVFRSIIPFAATRTVVLTGNYITRPDLLSMDGRNRLAISSHDE